MLRWLLSVIVVLIVGLTLAVTAILGTEPGAAWLIGELELLAPGMVTFRDLHGTWTGGLHFAEARITVARSVTSIEDADLRIVPSALLHGRLEVAQLRAAVVEVVVHPDPDDHTPFHMPTIAAPIRVDLEAVEIGALTIAVGDKRQSATGIKLAATLAHSHLTIRDFTGRSGPVAVALNGAAELRHPLPMRAQTSWSVDDRSFKGGGEIEGDLLLLHFRQRVELPDPVSVAGTLRNVAHAPLIDATASWETLRLLIPKLGAVTSTGGRVSLAGDWSAYHGSLAARVLAPNLPEAALSAAVRGAGEQLTLEEIRLGGGFGLVTGRGTLDLSAGPTFALQVLARDLNPAAIRADARGRISFRADVSGRLPDEINMRLVELNGSLMGRPLAGRGLVSYRAGGWSFTGVDLRAGPNRLEVNGTLDRALAGRFVLDAPRLDILWPALHGSMTGHGSIAGTLARPVLTADLTGRGLVFGDGRVADLTLTGSINPRGSIDLKLHASGLASGSQEFGELAVSAGGTLARHEISGNLEGGVLEANLRSQGAWDGRMLREQVGPALVSAAAIGPWHLRDDGVSLRLQGSTIELGNHCWSQVQAAVCFTGVHWSAREAGLAAALRGYSLEHLTRWQEDNLVFAGTASADLTLRQTAAGLRGRLSWRQENTAVYYTGDDEPLVRVFPEVYATADVTPQLASLQAAITGDAGIKFRGEARLSEPFSRDGALHGEFHGELPDIADLLPLLAPSWGLADLQGRINLQGTLGGTRSEPKLIGVMALRDGAIALPNAGVKLEAINLTVQGNETAALTIDGTARSGGEVRLSGDVQLRGENAPSARLRLRGQNLDAVRIPDRYVQASPDITLRYQAGRLSVDGSVEIPKAEITVRELPATAASTSPDAVVHDRPAVVREKARGPVIEGGLQLSFGDAVHLKAFGLDTNIGGGLRLYQTPAGYAAGEGVVRLVNGKFRKSGKELNIDRGTLAFSGPLDDPTLDVRATRHVDYEGQSIDVGVLLSGTAQHVESRVFSDPAMSEADALSYLFSGRPMAKASGADQSSMSSAALSMGLGQTSPLTEQIGSAIALDELGFEGSGLQETQVVAGKQIASDLYVRFAYGVFSRVGTVLARYRIGKRVSIEASSGDEQALDLVYSIEVK